MKPLPLAAPVFVLAALLVVAGAGEKGRKPKRTFGVWATSCSHVPADIRRGRESLADAIRQSESEDGFDWDVMIDAGDLSAHQTPPGDRDGQELLRQYRALEKHRREQVYNVPGNHDAPYYDHGSGSWFRKWGDPLGENTEFSGVDAARRPFPVEGNWERYRFEAGNLLFLMLADRNDAPTPVGRGHSREGNSGGYPPGAVTRETFEWWKEQVLANQDRIIVTMHHHALRDTTTASGYGEGNPKYHGSTGGAEGSSYLYFLIENDDPDDFRFTPDAHVFEDFLDSFHREHGRGAIDFWIAGHTHMRGPDDDHGGKTITEKRWGVNFLQCAGLTRHHGGGNPLSRLLTFTDGSGEVLVRTWLHDRSYQGHPVGFYHPAERVLALRHSFEAPPEIEAMTPFPGRARVFAEPYAREGEGRGVSGAAAAVHPAAPSPDLLGDWTPEAGGPFALEGQVEGDATTRRIDRAPTLVSKEGTVSLEFDGTNRLRVGGVDMEEWSGLTVGAWIRTKRNDPGMRVISKDRLGTPGNFMLLQRGPDHWVFQVWDEAAEKWAAASFHGGLGDGEWHHLAGTADAESGKVRLFVDGSARAEAAWTASTLDDSDGTDLVVGADSGEGKFGQGFRGGIREVVLYPRALSDDEMAAMAGGGRDSGE